MDVGGSLKNAVVFCYVNASVSQLECQQLKITSETFIITYPNINKPVSGRYYTITRPYPKYVYILISLSKILAQGYCCINIDPLFLTVWALFVPWVYICKYFVIQCMFGLL